MRNEFSENTKQEMLISLKAPLVLASRVSGIKTEQLYRTEFMRDRDRVLYSKSFRRLAGKTQVYVSGVDDHKRTRLTHTLEVSQISRTIASALKLDTDLTEAIALGHDLGHAPFGHIGERTFHELMTPHKNHELGLNCPLNKETVQNNLEAELGFKHNLQSLKNAMEFERNYGEQGLDLTNFTLYGIQVHSSSVYKKGRVLNHDKLEHYEKYNKKGCKLENGRDAWSFESFVVAEADEIAQRHHDVEDAIRGKLISRQEITKTIKSNFENYLSKRDISDMDHTDEQDEEVFIATISRIIVNMFVSRLVHSSIVNLNKLVEEKNINENNFKNFLLECKNVTEMKKLIAYDVIGEETSFTKCAKDFQRTVTDRILSSYEIQRADAKGKYVLKKIFQAYYTTPQQLPDYCVFQFLMRYDSEKYSEKKLRNDEERYGVGKIRKEFTDIVEHPERLLDIDKLMLMRIICDYLAGMTDGYACKIYNELYG